MAKENGTLATTGAVAMWETGTAPDGFEMISKPTIIKLRDIPVGGYIDCVPLEVQPSTNKAIKQPLLLVELTASKQKALLPMQATLASALLDEDEECNYIGKRINIRKGGVKHSNKYKDDNGKPREFSLWEVSAFKGGKK